VAARRTASAWIRSEAVGARQAPGSATMHQVPAGVAQQAEQPSCKRQVSGSTPLTGSQPMYRFALMLDVGPSGRWATVFRLIADGWFGCDLLLTPS
jgi:hypothetical protein